MPPLFHDSGKPVQHQLELKFNALGWDILTAIENGFRAQVDVKGKLAELFLVRQLNELLQQAIITQLTWNDRDRLPDFLITYNAVDLRIECKNVRSPIRLKPTKRPRTKPPPAWRVEIQKTRNQLTGGPKRGYKADEFDILAACLFNQTGKWEYLFIPTAELKRRPKHPDYLEIMQPVPPSAQGHWTAGIEDMLRRLVP